MPLPSYRPICVSIKRDLDIALKAKLSRYGDRSKLINRLIEMYLQGKVQVVLPAQCITKIRAERRL